MAWRKLDLADVAAHLSQEEMDGYRQYGDFRTNEDPIVVLCKEVAAFCRMKLRKNFFVKLSPNVDELPPELISPACDIVAFKILKRMPVETTEARKLAYTSAIELLNEIQEDKIRPESYKEETDDSSADDEEEDLRNEPFMVVNMRPDILR